ncbi:hexuronic acid methyltransferase AglP [Halalkalicoccus paucihalophilus]|uniref:Hexuronic acid methyltransferase AglP n=1 Tax=Halalkalicoccus paucihalophilus TaxID=1008153 RepID=A0A151AKL6_9EURY|nr:FkbM family methyltransferase [Halalkalicoccus paucihalophilus]KYH27947.1 hexuronic acid methyltransferase AglP [Halalkalicoccus paucihalophilus]
MHRTTVIDAVFRGLRDALAASRSLPNAVYYRLAGLNYRYRAIATEKRVRDESFRSYELYDRHGNDWLLAALLDRCRDGDVVVDVGANTGVYALSVAAEYPESTVVALEPNPRIAETLRANVAVSGFDERIRSLEVGLGAEDGSLPFHRSSYHELSSFNRFNAERFGARVVDIEEVPIRTLDSLVDGGEVPPPDHLKVDVEGFGLDVLRGAREVLATHRPFVYVEPHARNEGESDDRGEAAAGIRDLLVTERYTIIPGEDGWVCIPEESRE